MSLPSRGSAVFRLLDLAFGFFVWAVHFATVYATASFACALGMGSVSLALTVITVVAGAGVALHGWLRYRRMRAVPDQAFRLSVIIGCDAIAMVAIVWQLFPILLAPTCTRI